MDKSDIVWIKKKEVYLMTALKFNLVVHSPLRALKGFFLDIEIRKDLVKYLLVVGFIRNPYFSAGDSL
eukprot:m.153459 g.153459  ORF g.153459 m.153459 type:complete len:68 (+) comp15066_c0_seq4:477-680(+)